MPYKLLTLLLVSVLCFLGCTRNHEDPTLKVIQHAQPAVVKVVFDGGWCSGTHIGRGIILTAAHCLRPDNTTTSFNIVDVDLDIYEGKTTFVSPYDDIMLISSNVPISMPYLLLASPDLYPIPSGTPMLVLGYPGYFNGMPSFETGYVKANIDMMGRDVLLSNNMAYPGESGGPAIDLSSMRIIGIVKGHIEMGPSRTDISVMVSTLEIYYALASYGTTEELCVLS